MSWGERDTHAREDWWSAAGATWDASSWNWNARGDGDDQGGGWGGGWNAGGGGWDWAGGGTGGNAAWEEFGSTLDLNIDWTAAHRALKIEKNFYHEHYAVSARTDSEVAEIREARDIEILSGRSVPKPVLTFEEASLPPFLMDRLRHHPEFKAPTPIQVQVLPVALQGHDLIGIAETGSGKTLAYLLPMMVHILAQPELNAGDGPVGVVLCPTRELAHQIDSVAKDFVGTSGLKSLAIFGGYSVSEQRLALAEKVDIVVATPGRFIQFLNEGKTNLNRVTYVVLDEADEMLDKGFGQQMELIMSQVRPERQILMFSATWPADVQALAKKHLKTDNDPTWIRVGGDKLAACRTITQLVVIVEKQLKFKKLVQALEMAKCTSRGSLAKCLVFCKMKTTVDEVHDKLTNERNIDATCMHSDKTQKDRSDALQDFKEGQCSLMICTGVLGRGHDIPRVKFVINYDAPQRIEDYVHRVGRTGRAGEKGFAMTFVTQSEDYGIAADLVLVLQETGQQVPPGLKDMARGGAESEWTC